MFVASAQVRFAMRTPLFQNGGIVLFLAVNGRSINMEGLAVIGFVFGVVAFVRVEKLRNTLKEKGILDHDSRED